MKSAVVLLPGLNRDRDLIAALTKISGTPPVTVWQTDTEIPDVDLIAIPGGFSYGDYLRSGAIARFSPIMQEVARHAAKGGLVFGVCNGFQVLCEAGLLPGVLTRNAGLKFHCTDQRLRVERADTAWTSRYDGLPEIVIPLKHAEGRYVADEHTLDELEAEGRVLFRYVGANPNGALRDIAGICSADGRIAGLMPHPEHAIDVLTGPSTDGLAMFTSLIDSLAGAAA